MTAILLPLRALPGRDLGLVDSLVPPVGKSRCKRPRPLGYVDSWSRKTTTPSASSGL